MHILIIEDEHKLAQAIQESLHAQGYSVEHAADGEDGFYRASTQAFELLILDLNLPGRDGIEILQALRAQGRKIPVLILTARDGLEQRVEGLDAGADDYLVKPFAFPELHARIRALTRRGRAEDSAKLRCADLEMDRIARTVARDGQVVDLTTKEFEILECLLKHQGQVVSREMLARELWEERARVVALDNVIDVHMARLRAKVDNPFGQTLIRTVRGVGFMIRTDV